MVLIASVLCEKFRQDIGARSFALIAPVWHVLHQVLCSSETVPSALKRKGTHQNLSLQSNGVDRERSLRKILTRHRGTNFCIKCTSLAHFAASFVQLRNGSKCTQMKRTHQNMSLGSNYVDRERSLRITLTRHPGTNFCINCTRLACFASSFLW
jgi:hypothetical protein